MRAVITVAASIVVLASLSAGRVVGTQAATKDAFPITPNASNNLDCNGWSTSYKPVSAGFKMRCTDPIATVQAGGENGKASAFEDNGHYVGHDEPSIRFVSTSANSGNTFSYYMQLPVDPAGTPTTSGSTPVTDTAELTPAPWFGLPICDPDSYPAYDNESSNHGHGATVQAPCTADSDGNNASNNGTSFMELQLYPPKFGPFLDMPSCDSTRWCVALTIDALELQCPTTPSNGGCEPNPACAEPVNFSYLTLDGKPTGPPGPEDATVATETPNADTLFLNPGDTIKLQIQDTPTDSALPALQATVTDYTTGQSGFVQASAANGFQTVDPTTCDGATMNFHASYSTANANNTVAWSALEGGVLMEQEIGHGEPCGSVSNQIPSSFLSEVYPAPFSDTDTYETCGGGSEGDDPGEGPCNVSSGLCTNSTTQEGEACPSPANFKTSDAHCEFADATCVPAGPRPVTTQQTTDGADPTTVNQTWDAPIPLCLANLFQNGDLDFDGSSYQDGTWPNGGGDTPTSFKYLGPFDHAGTLYPNLQFETDAPGSEQFCDDSTGAGCVVPPAGAPFYPFFSITNDPGQLPAGLHASGTPCVWNFGDDITGVTDDDFGKADGEYGTPDTSQYEGTLITGGSRTSTIPDPADGHPNGASNPTTCTAITQSQVSYNAFTALTELNAGGQTTTFTPTGSSTIGPTLWSFPIARGVALLPGSSGGYILDGFGGVHAFGGAQPAHMSAYWNGWDIARSIALLPDDTGGYVMDGFGGLHPFSIGSNPMPPFISGGPYWNGWDIAKQIVLRTATSGYLLDGWGGVHSFGGAPAISNFPYWKGWDIARSFTLDPDGNGGYELDGWGGVHAFGNARPVIQNAYWRGWDIARSIVQLPGTTGEGYVLDGFGNIHPFGDTVPMPVSPSETNGTDDFRSLSIA